VKRIDADHLGFTLRDNHVFIKELIFVRQVAAQPYLATK